jgi:hypothetical protein
MKLSELLNISFPELEEAMSRQELENNISKRQRTQFVDAMLKAMHRLVTSKGDRSSIGGYAFDIARSFGMNPKEVEQLYRERYMTEDEERPTVITQSMLDKLEQYLDALFSKLDIDVEFTRHFLDRANDPRNKKQITLKELAILFKDAYTKYGKKIAQMGPDAEAVIKDMRSDVNVPFVLNWDNRNQELDLVAKTVMRKKDFRTPDTELPLN